jgi:bacterioferritin (cytochrome b1)
MLLYELIFVVDDNEWKVRYESQVALNKQQEEHKDWLETELAEARRKLTTGNFLLI